MTGIRPPLGCSSSNYDIERGGPKGLVRSLQRAEAVTREFFLQHLPDHGIHLYPPCRALVFMRLCRLFRDINRKTTV